MLTAWAYLAIAQNQLKQVPAHPLLYDAMLDLTVAVALAEAYGKIQNSIFWKDSTETTKHRVRGKLNEIAFDAYSHLLNSGKALNQYVDEVGAENIPAEWRELIGNLSWAARIMQQEHSPEIAVKQLTLNLNG